MANPLLDQVAVELTNKHPDRDLFYDAKGLVCQISVGAHWLVLPVLAIADRFFEDGNRMQAIELVSFVCRNAYKSSASFKKFYQQAEERLEHYLNNVDRTVGKCLGRDRESIKTKLEKSYQKFRDQITLHTGTIPSVEEAVGFIKLFPLRPPENFVSMLDSPCNQARA